MTLVITIPPPQAGEEVISFLKQEYEIASPKKVGIAMTVQLQLGNLKIQRGR